MNATIDKHNRLDEDVFTYRATKDMKVFILWYERRVKTLSGMDAERFLHKVEDLDEKGAQLLMAKLTGNFKRGNERKERE